MNLSMVRRLMRNGGKSKKRALLGSSRRERPGEKVDCDQRPIPALSGVTALPTGSFRSNRLHEEGASLHQRCRDWGVAELQCEREARHARESGVALVIVLALLTLLSVLLVSFMMTATTELTATQAASAGNISRQLGDMTINLVIGQLREATTQADEQTTWSSQPGAIRTFSGRLSNTPRLINGQGAYTYYYAAGGNDFVYKLYSSDKLKVPWNLYSSTDLPGEVRVIENWATDKPAEYVDLNEPLLEPRLDLDSSGKRVEPHYPIIDPRAMFNREGTAAVSDAKPPIVEGFDAKLTFDEERVLADSGEKVPYLPMPVKWLYVLKDGSIDAPQAATTENPIIGRIAFWADDETCKLNINTASEGTFWDTPSASTEQESGDVDAGEDLTSSRFSLSLSTASPVAGEYQRYPGHPMSTCLSPVLGWIWGLTPSMSLYPQDNASYATFKEAIYKIAPFTPSGDYTTQGATVNAAPNLPFDGSRPKQSVATKRLYATVDELIFKSARNKGGTDPEPELNDFSELFTPDALEKTRFFLSANSRAPELNLFGRPRVTLWPIHTNYRYRTHFDDLFAFTSTIAKTHSESTDKRYFLTRQDAKSDTVDFDAQNQAMYEYLRDLTEKPIPGFGGSLRGKYPSPECRDQILTEIFDYVRTVNLVDTGEASKSTNVFIPYTPRFYPEEVDQTYSRKSRAIDWSGQVTPLKIGPTMGMGRFFTISEAALVFHKLPGATAGLDSLQATLLLEMATTMPGYPAIRETYWTRVSTLKKGGIPERRLQIAIGNGSFQDVELCTQEASPNDRGLINVCNVAAHEVTFGRGFMPVLGFTAAMHYHAPHFGLTYPENYVRAEQDPNFRQTGSTNPKPKTFTWQKPVGGSVAEKSNVGVANYNRTETVKNYPYVSKPIPIAGAATFRFIGPRLEVEIWSGQGPDDPRSRLVQTVELNFPEQPTAALPMPASGAFTGRLDGSLEGKWDCLTADDVVRSIEFVGPQIVSAPNARGDLRLAAALQHVPGDYFQPRDGESVYKSSAKQVHGLTCSHGDAVTGHTQGRGGGNQNSPGRLVANGTVRTSKPPILPRQLNGVTRADNGPGDWDRGISKHMDGAFGNKVDEGNLKFDMKASGSSRLPYFRGRGIEETGQSFFTPNRQLPSPVMLGSLPSGINPLSPADSKPWQTLLFRPDRENGSARHPGAAFGAMPADHLWLDLFHVPVVEPYAISEPFSTAGKVNMNYVIAPFGYARGASGTNPNTIIPRSYLRRDSALRGVLRSTWMMAVPNGASEMAHHESAQKDKYYRYPIDLDRTIEEMEIRLNDQRQGVENRQTALFRSASEICDIDLYPKSTPGGPDAPSVSSWSLFWNSQFAATGDNMRERPYAHIYPRLTTRSNVYTVHMRCQAIRKSPNSKPNEFDPRQDKVASEYRGSAVIERFIDPNDPALRNYNHKTERAEPYYRFRVVSTKHFVGN